MKSASAERTAKDRLWHLLDGNGSRWIALRHKITIIAQLYTDKLETDATDLDLAVDQLIRDTRDDYNAVHEELEAAYASMEKDGAR